MCIYKVVKQIPSLRHYVWSNLPYLFKVRAVRCELLECVLTLRGAPNIEIWVQPGLQGSPGHQRARGQMAQHAALSHRGQHAFLDCRHQHDVHGHVETWSFLTDGPDKVMLTDFPGLLQAYEHPQGWDRCILLPHRRRRPHDCTQRPRMVGLLDFRSPHGDVHARAGQFSAGNIWLRDVHRFLRGM
jgi:hypothetical protein